jgi:hypothetical protein
MTDRIDASLRCFRAGSSTRPRRARRLLAAPPDDEENGNGDRRGKAHQDSENNREDNEIRTSQVRKNGERGGDHPVRLR